MEYEFLGYQLHNYIEGQVVSRARVDGKKMVAEMLLSPEILAEDEAMLRDIIDRLTRLVAEDLLERDLHD